MGLVSRELSAEDTIDIAVIGAGVLGCAVASKAARAGFSVMVLEREETQGRGISSRNSGVIHSGLYYDPQSLKARSCVRGQTLLYEWLKRHDVPHRQTGKLVLATTADELADLTALYSNAKLSGAREIRMVTVAEISEMEPDLPKAFGAVHCGLSGIVDPHALTYSLWVDAAAHGATLVCNAELLGAETTSSGFLLETSKGPLSAVRVVNAAGLFADEVGQLLGYDAPRIYPCRGDYFRLKTAGRYHHLIYPVRKQFDSGLGVHLTIDLAGAYRVGPDAFYVASKTDFSPADDKASQFKKAAERLLGPVQSLVWDGCGIRPKLRAPTECVERDFRVEADANGAIHLLGIESPGLTACLALAEEVVSRLV